MNPTALTEMVDRVFDDRYRVEELVGVGTVSAVFSAFDMAEDRRVALKVFDVALANDERFVERLLEAAEHASVLGHTNIVEILDWGFDKGPYIVSELCEGGSLAALLEEGHRLATSQALVMALECARALNYGHEQGAIHRNLTPHNVLFTADHHVRVSDYGLATVLAEAPAAQSSRALENVRYASPEQARGRLVGESSDMYSLALVVSEAVSGSAPQVSETVVGTLMDRAEAPAVLDEALGGLLPSLERCGRVDPQQRPEAEELAISLLATAEGMPRPQALPVVGIGYQGDMNEVTLLVSGGSRFVAKSSEALTEMAEPGQPDQNVGPAADNGFDASVVRDPDGTDAFATEDGLPKDRVSQDRVPDQNAAQDAVLQNRVPEDRVVEGHVVDDSVPKDAASVGDLENLEQADPVFAQVSGVSVEAELDVPQPAPTGRSTRVAYEETSDDADDRLPWWPLALLVVLIAGATAAWVYFVALDETADSAAVPDLIGVQFDEIAGRLEGRSWEVIRLEDRVDGTVVGSVISQDPGPGKPIESDDRLTVTVSLGNEMVEIPSDIVGLTVDQAASRLGTVGLLVGRVTEEENEALDAGLVIGLDEPTTQMPTGQGVDLRVSAGPEDRIVPPGVVGLSIGDATSLLVGLRLQAFEEPTFDPDVEVGTVLASFPPGGEVVSADSAVTLFVSAGPEPVDMPDIVGLQLDEAVDVIEALGLIFIDTTGTPGEEVIGSLPPIGAEVDVGTEVTIILNDPVEEDEEDETDS